MGGVRTPFVNLQVAFWLILMTPSIVSLAVIWPLANMSLRGQVLVSTQVGSVASTVKSGVEKFNILVSSPSLKIREHCRCCTQNGIRGGSATVHFPIWHQEIEDIIVLKNNKGTEDNRVRKLDYSIQLSGLLQEVHI
ncbi:MAG: hypothetical protein CM15mV10_1590 [uncultured marine virus]|nr:MAG: hypothetical protein CM15mV10_1590 [uncultured marine virus]